MSTHENPYAFYETDEERTPDWARFEFDFGEVYAEAESLGILKNTKVRFHLEDNRLSIVCDNGKTFELAKDDAKELFRIQSGNLMVKLPEQKFYWRLHSASHHYELSKIVVWASCNPVDRDDALEMVHERLASAVLNSTSLMFYVYLFDTAFFITAPFGFVLPALLAIVYVVAYVQMKRRYVMWGIGFMMMSSILMTALFPIASLVLFYFDDPRPNLYWNLFFSVFIFSLNAGATFFLWHVRNRFRTQLLRLKVDFPI